MIKYEINIRVDNSYDIVEVIEAATSHQAITSVREKVKAELNPEHIWIYNMKEVE